jgi:biotin carboxyl carrier protein
VLKIITHDGKEFQLDGNELNGKLINADISPIGKYRFHILRNGKSTLVSVVKTDPASKTVTLRIEGKKYVCKVKDQYDEILEKLGMSGQAKAIKELKAPMPGKVLDIMVNIGETVTKDQALLVLEAMKMENVIKSPGEGKIKSISIQKANTVEKNQVMNNFE